MNLDQYGFGNFGQILELFHLSVVSLPYRFHSVSTEINHVHTFFALPRLHMVVTLTFNGSRGP